MDPLCQTFPSPSRSLQPVRPSLTTVHPHSGPDTRLQEQLPCFCARPSHSLVQLLLEGRLCPLLMPSMWAGLGLCFFNQLKTPALPLIGQQGKLPHLPGPQFPPLSDGDKNAPAYGVVVRIKQMEGIVRIVQCLARGKCAQPSFVSVVIRVSNNSC